MKIEIDLKIILLLILFIFTSQIQIYGMFIVFIFLHELSHIIVALLLGMKLENIKINMFGISAELYNYKTKNWFKIITYLAGPIFNLLCTIIFNRINVEENIKFQLVYINISLFVFNLLPIVPLDGGRILKEILKIKYGNIESSRIILYLSKFLLMIFTLIYSVLILKLKNLAILFLIIYLWYLYIIEKRKFNLLERAYEIIESHKLKKDIEIKLI